jgi:tRNA threonylcarbamoyladenosine biosynthesis protein TsaB
MIVLALDTTTRTGSSAVLRDGRVVRERTGDPTVTHGERLPSDLMQLLGDARLTIGAIDLFAVAAGPGSFTGLRVGIAAIQGLAMATGKAVVPVSALEALARASADGSVPVAPWIDAQRGEVFASLFDATGLEALAAAIALPPAATLATLPDSIRHTGIRFAGDGALRYAGEIRSALGENARVVPEVPLLAGVIGQIASEAPERAVPPHAVSPIYIRRPDAELARDRRTQRA